MQEFWILLNFNLNSLFLSISCAVFIIISHACLCINLFCLGLPDFASVWMSINDLFEISIHCIWIWLQRLSSFAHKEIANTYVCNTLEVLNTVHKALFEFF